MIASIDAVGVLVAPFQSHSSIGPPLLMAVANSFGAFCRRPRTSIRLDLPEPFGPMRTLRRCKSITVASPPNDRRFRIDKLRITGSSGMSVDGPNYSVSQQLLAFRSEERRVGKECRSRW